MATLRMSRLWLGKPPSLVLISKSWLKKCFRALTNESLSEGTNLTAALLQFYPAFTSADIEDYERVYPLSDYESAEQRLNVATGESEFRCARHIIGLAAARKNDVYTYRYNQPIPTVPTDLVTHGAENWMMFRGTFLGYVRPPCLALVSIHFAYIGLCRYNGTTTFQPQSDVELAFAEELIAYWLSFVRAGDPNTYKLQRSPVWPKYDADEMKRIVLQEPESGDPNVSGSTVEAEPAAESARCEFVASKAEQQQA